MWDVRILGALAAGALAMALSVTRLLVPAVWSPSASKVAGPAANPVDTRGTSDDASVARAASPSRPDAGDAGGDEEGGARSARPGARAPDRRPTAPAVRAVPRSRVEAVLADPSKLRDARAAYQRAAPGRIAGYRLAGIGEDNPLHRIGLRSGDLLTSVNGLRIDDADAALEAFARLRDASRIRLVIRRNGSRRVLRYRIHDGAR